VTLTREEFAKKIYWDKVMWVVGYANPLIALPQLVKLLRTSDASGVSAMTLFWILGIQIGFSAHGFFKRDKMLFISNAIAATLTGTTTIVALALGATW
jgi:uncharacterized protein with PQ loop repeat